MALLTGGLAAQCVYRRPEKVGECAGEECSRGGHRPVHPQHSHTLHDEEEERNATQGANILQTQNVILIPVNHRCQLSPHTLTSKGLLNLKVELSLCIQ